MPNADQGFPDFFRIVLVASRDNYYETISDCDLVPGQSSDVAHLDGFLPSEFVASGPFPYVRNPMSPGARTLVLGLGLYEHSISVLLLAVLLIILLHLLIVYVEEPGLQKRFGASYEQDKQSANRWLPGFHRS